IYLEPLLRVDSMHFRALLWAVQHRQSAPSIPSTRRLSRPIEIDQTLSASFYRAIGLRVVSGLAMRPDRLERGAAALRRAARGGSFALGAELAAVAGVDTPTLRRLLASLGYRAVIDAGQETFVVRPRRRRDSQGEGNRRIRTGEDHPFAKLRKLKLA